MEPDGIQVEVLWYGPCAELYLAGAVNVLMLFSTCSCVELLSAELMQLSTASGSSVRSGQVRK